MAPGSGTAPSVATDAREQIIKVAKGKIGTAYSVMDCSGFVRYVYRAVFPSFPKLIDTAGIAASSLFRIVASPQKGDLIFFPAGTVPYDGSSHGNHVGIVVDAFTWIGSQTSGGVAVVSMSNPWWNSRKRNYLRYTGLAG